ncbi:MAG: hypothetical protein WDM77_01500 [Steroidobacteraceae bacterium]
MAPHFTPARLTRHPDGITAVDTEYIRPGLAAAHLIQHGAAAAFVDVGTNYSVPHLLAALQNYRSGLRPSNTCSSPTYIWIMPGARGCCCSRCRPPASWCTHAARPI